MNRTEQLPPITNIETNLNFSRKKIKMSEKYGKFADKLIEEFDKKDKVQESISEAAIRLYKGKYGENS